MDYLCEYKRYDVTVNNNRCVNMKPLHVNIGNFMVVEAWFKIFILVFVVIAF